MSKVKVTMMALAAAVALIMTSQAFADTVSISATADSSIYKWRSGTGSNAQDTAYGYDDILKIRWHGVADSHKLYVKFTLPADFATATSATVKIVFAGGTGGYSYDLYGLKDNAAGQDWAEGSGYIYPKPASDGITWRNAPANKTDDGHLFTSDATGILATAMAPYNAGQCLSFSSQDLIDFINTDTDKVITFMVSGHSDTTADPDFASRENTTYDGPTLELTYTPVPEPASIIILSSLVSLATRKRF